MRPLRRPTRSTIHYHGRDSYGVVTFSINGVRWEYDLLHQQIDDCEYIIRKGGAAKGLAYAKPRASASRRIDPAPAMATLLRHRGGIASRAKRVKPGMPNV